MSLFPNLIIKGLRPKRYTVSYPTELRHVGDHIRKTRLERGLTSEKVAEILGVSIGTISQWEVQKRIPQIYTFPAIIKFLGYNPMYIDDTSLLSKVENYRRVHGLTYKKLAKLCSIGHETIQKIVAGNMDKHPKVVHKILNVIEPSD